MNWILCGFKRCGKSFFGKRLGLPFLDTDQLIEQEVGQSVREIVLKSGMDFFRALEKEVICKIDVEGTVIAPGGGAVFDPGGLLHLKKLGKLIYLRCPKQVLKERIFTPPQPTFIDCEETFEEIYSQRIPQYEKISSHTVDLEGKSDEEILEELWQVINLDRSFASQHGESPMGRQLGL